MRTIVKSNVKNLAVVLSAAMILNAAVLPTAGAKVKKPALSKTKVSLAVGSKKTVKVTNAKKVTWTINKAGKKVISLSKKSNKGATITGVKVGKATISVSMKYGKKTLKKTISVSVTNKASDTNTTKPTPTAAPSAAPTPGVSPTDAPATPEPAPGTKPDDGSVKLDLSAATVPEGAEDAIKYDAATNTLNVVDTSLFRLPLPEQLPMGSEVTVKVTGTLKGELGFRSYLVADDQDSAMSTIANSDEDGVAIGEPFEWEFALTNEVGDANQIQFKGISYSQNIDDLTITGVTVQYSKAE